jgi:hypothetical protein
LLNVNETCKYKEKYNAEMPEIFSKKVGTIKDVKVKLHINEKVIPTRQYHQRCPHHLKRRLNNEITRLLGEHTIERAKGPTKWINCLVPVEKGSEALRLCLDGRNCNTEIMRERHITPTIEDVIQAAGNAKFKSHLDFNQAYHQILLDEASRHITTFIVDGGIYWFRKLVFGISSA